MNPEPDRLPTQSPPITDAQFADPNFNSVQYVDQNLHEPLEVPAALRGAVNTSAGWLTAIAVFSLINALIAHLGGGIHFIIGLGITQIAFAIIQEIKAPIAIAWVFSLVVAAGFIVLGIFARRLMLWAFIVGIMFYVLDALLLVLVQDWLSVAFHAYALWAIFVGTRILWKIRHAV